MKTIVPGKRFFTQPFIYSLFMLVVFMLVQSPVKANPTREKQYKDSIVINKLLTSKKYKIKIYPGASNEVLFFNASGDDGKVYQFFIFDVEGALVKQTQIRNKQTTILTNFNKGCYTFEVFSDDEHIENGTLTIK
ncbi:MAG: T9SS type A sorting domain-containing protein [Chitinophagaceae bacterium]